MKNLSIIARGTKFDDFLKQDNENWAVCSTYIKGKHIRDKIDKYFQVHKAVVCKSRCNKCTLLNDVQDERLVFKHKEFKEKPCAEIIDEERLKSVYGKVFHNTVAYMLAYAFEKGYTDITIHGVDMTQRVEYLHQRDGVFFLLGYAKAKGIKVHLMPHSGLNTFNKNILYGDY